MGKKKQLPAHVYLKGRVNLMNLQSYFARFENVSAALYMLFFWTILGELEARRSQCFFSLGYPRRVSAREPL